MSTDKPMNPLTPQEREALRKAPKKPGGFSFPNPHRKISGAERRELKKQAERLCAEICQGGQWLVLGFTVENGMVKMGYKIANFPNEAFETAAGQFARLLAGILEEHGQSGAAEIIAAHEAEREAETAAQTSEPTDAEVNALPTSLGGSPVTEVATSENPADYGVD